MVRGNASLNAIGYVAVPFEDGELFRRRFPASESPPSRNKKRFGPFRYGFGRNKIPSNRVDEPELYEQFFDSQCETRWNDLRLAILDVDSTETGLEIIRASQHFKGDFWALWEDNASRKAVSLKYVGSTTAWTAGGTITDTPVYDAASSGQATATSLTFSHTTINKPDRVIVVCVASDNADPTGITYNSVSLTRLNGINISNRYSSMWYLVAPATGANNVVVSRSGSDEIVAGATTYYHVDQGSPVSNAGTNSGNSQTSSSIAGTTTASDIAVDALTLLDPPSGTVGSGQTQRWQLLEGDIEGSSSTERATGTSTTMSWTFSSATVAHTAARVNGLKTVGLDLLAHKTHLLALVASGSSHEIWRSTDGAAFTVATTQPTTDLLSNDVTTNEYIDAGLLAEIGGEAVAVLWHEANGTITFYSSTNAGDTWSDEAVDIASGNGPQGVAVMVGPDNEDKLYLATSEGLYEIDTSPSTWTWRLLNRLPNHIDNGRRMAVHNAELWYALGVDDNSPAPVYKLRTLDGIHDIRVDMGLNTGDGIPDELLGPVRWMEPVAEFLFMSVGGGAASRNSRVLVRNEFGWHSAHRHGTAQRRIEWIGYSAEDDGTPRLHMARNSAASSWTSNTAFLPTPATNPQSGVSISRESSGLIDLPRIGWEVDGSIWLQARVEADDLSADTSGEYIDCSHGADGAARNNADLGDFLSGAKKLDYASGAGAGAVNDGIRLVLNRDAGTATDTPKVHHLEMVYLEQPEAIEQWEFLVSLEETAAVNDLDIEAVVTNLEAARDKVTLPTFQYANTSVKYVKVVALQWQEQVGSVGEADISSVPDIIARRGGIVRVVVEELIT